MFVRIGMNDPESERMRALCSRCQGRILYLGVFMRQKTKAEKKRSGVGTFIIAVAFTSNQSRVV